MTALTKSTAQCVISLKSHGAAIHIPLRYRTHTHICKHLKRHIHTEQTHQQHLNRRTSPSAQSDILLPSTLYQQYIDTGYIKPDQSQQSVLHYMNDILLNVKPHQQLMQQYWHEVDQWTELRQSKVQAELERRERLKHAIEQNKQNAIQNRSIFSRLSQSIFGTTNTAANTSTDTNARYRLSTGSNLDELDQSYTVRDGYTGSGKAIWPWLQSKVNNITQNQSNSTDIDYNSIEPEYLPNTYYGISDEPVPPQPPKGLYMYGSVGSGKTLMMDLLYKCTASIVDNRIRVHFNEFLIQIYSIMHEYHIMSQQQRGLSGALHPLDYVCNKLIGGRRLLFLCFDELQLNDVSEAVILKGLFQRLLQRGIILVMTGNRQPNDISKSHLNRTDFNGFLELIQDRCHLANIQSGIDYRRVAHSNHIDVNDIINNAQQYNNELYTQLSQQYKSFPMFDVSSDTNAQQHFVQCIETILTHEAQQYNDTVVVPEQQILTVRQGRRLTVKHAYHGIAKFTFDELCSSSLGSADYLSIAQQYHTVIIEYVPLLSINDRDKIRRFIWLIDQLYNNNTCLVTCLATNVDALFQTNMFHTLQAEIQENLQYEGEVARRGIGVQNRNAEQLWSGADEAFAYARSASRLNEMCTKKYWTKRNRSTL